MTLDDFRDQMMNLLDDIDRLPLSVADYCDLMDEFASDCEMRATALRERLED